ncbi:MAG: glycosyltransferase family 4 protein [Crocosphaera sp.]|nr:glycosyltransferase family 4 protein [Crocosphaera sp.]
MKKPSLTICYQFNPWNSSIGGIQTIIRSFLKYAPEAFEVKLIGTGNEREKIGRWEEKEFVGKIIKFMPLFYLPNDDVRGLIPTSIKYTTALWGKIFTSDFFHFHRLEPTLMTKNWQGEKTLFLHNDIRQQMDNKTNKKAILWQYFPWAYFTLEKTVIPQFDQILSCNSETTQFYQEQYPTLASKIMTIKNAVDGNIFSPLTPQQKKQQRQQLAQELNLPLTTQFLLFAGRLHPQKDPLLLIRSLQALNNTNVHLLIAGEGELTPQVKAEINQCQLNQQVTLLGSVNQDKLATLQRIASAFVLTSVYEGLPIVVLEALSSGTPVITTSCGETPKLLTPNSGLVCETRTPEAMAQSWRKVLSNPDDYPSDACVKTAHPYQAKTVITEVYQQMWTRWQQKLQENTGSAKLPSFKWEM